MIRYAVLADIHGNVWALDAVLADAKKRGAEVLLNLGDTLYGPLRPRETYERLMSEDVLATVSGNQDREICEATPVRMEVNPTLEYVVGELGDAPRTWLSSLPSVVHAGDLLLCHGSPSDDCMYLLEDVSPGRPLLRPSNVIASLVEGVKESVILCGHTHIPRLMQLPDGRMIVNPGSVGLPAYSDSNPVQHVMETHSPHASYAMLEESGRCWSVSFHRVPYDHQQAAEAAKSLGREDWAYALLTGWAAERT